MNKRGKVIRNRIFSVFLISKALCFTNSLFTRMKDSFMAFSPHIFSIGSSFELLLGPSLYFYTKSLAYHDFKFKSKDALHLVPFIIHIIFMSVQLHSIMPSDKVHQLMKGIIFEGMDIFTWLTLLTYIHFMIYSILSLIVLKNYRKELKNHCSSVENIKLSWLGFLVFGFILIWLLGSINLLLFVYANSILFFSYTIIICIFLFSNIIVFKGLKHPEIFLGIGEIVSNQKYAKTLLPQQEVDKYLKVLLDYMETEKPYLNPLLTIKDIARKINIPSYYLSQVINRGLNQNFFNFVNSYRIKESKKIFSDPNNHRRTVLEVLYEVGFNSKSVFNSSFKKHEGMTPTEFIRSQNKT